MEPSPLFKRNKEKLFFFFFLLLLFLLNLYLYYQEYNKFKKDEIFNTNAIVLNTYKKKDLSKFINIFWCYR